MKSTRLVFVVCFFSCTSVRESVEIGKKSEENQNSKKTEKQRFNESFDPLSVNDDDWVITKKPSYRKDPLSLFADSLASGDASKKETKEQIVFGFRVQLYSTPDYYAALSVRDEAGVKLSEDIYVDYEQPYYKIRAGNFTNREKAEEIKNLAKSIGYADAWVIQTKVLLKEK